MRTCSFCSARGLHLSAVLSVAAWLVCGYVAAAEPSVTQLTEAVRSLQVDVVPEDPQGELTRMVARDLERRRLAAIRRENTAWYEVRSLSDWEQFRDTRIAALRRSLGSLPEPGGAPRVDVTGVLEAADHRIEKLVYESRPGLVVTANLYRPPAGRDAGTPLPGAPAAGSRSPAIVLVHSHHNPKTQGELQDMGVHWARQGWITLVIDMLGHGERRQHPFVDASSFAGTFQVGRQDYYFRYNVGVQLQLVGESLMGWMVGDLIRGIDLLLARSDVDPRRILVVGSVAGGGDPAGVTAALDRRVAGVVPFNFGGYQPDYSIPENAEFTMYYFGVGYWETTRCLRLGGRDGFAPWVIVGSVAPRPVIYAHEFDWPRDRDPVWPRLEKIYSLYGAGDRLASSQGRGSVRGTPPESTHCNNVGAVHRRGLYPHWQRWFGMTPPPEERPVARREPQELVCLTAQRTPAVVAQPVYRLASELANARLAERRSKSVPPGTEHLRETSRQDWARLLGDIEPRMAVAIRSTATVEGVVHLERLVLETEPGITVPVALLRTAGEGNPQNRPTVVLVSGSGKARLLRERADVVARLLAGGAAVVLPDVRGTGETRAGDNYGANSTTTTLSCQAQILGETLLGQRLRDLRAVLRYLRSRPDGRGRMALWGDSVAIPNPPHRSPVVPLRVDNPNTQADPLGGLLVLLASLYEDDVDAAFSHGSLVSFRSLLASPFLYVGHDALLPGVLAASDLPELAVAIAPRPLRLSALVSGLHRDVSMEEARDEYDSARRAYELLAKPERFQIVAGRNELVSSAEWLLGQLQ